jgi:multidrug efflux pump subunit AcrA (membrane-fusion protein)
MTNGFAAGCAAVLLALGGCGRNAPVRVSAAGPPPAEAARSNTGPRTIRATGTIEAVRAFTVQAPRIEVAGSQGPQSQPARLTLIRLAPNGTQVKEGDLLAEFDRTAQVDAAREAKAKYEDLAQQVRQKAAENRSEVEKRALDIRQAEADLGKADIQLKKGPVLSDIDRLKNQEKATSARARLASLKKSDESRRQAEAAALRILELQMQRQKVALERAEKNAEQLVLKAPIAGMVALENIWKMGSMGAAQEGDQIWGGQALLKIFDPAQMQVRAFISEPDRAVLKPGTLALVNLDAYPDAAFQATFDSASPVATSAMGSPIKNFAARFRLSQADPRLLPDLSAAVLIKAEE